MACSSRISTGSGRSLAGCHSPWLERDAGARVLAGRCPHLGVGRRLDGLSTEIITQIDADAPIWEHKLFRPVPRLADGDGPVMAFRRWAEMFYTPEHFARMQSASRRDSMATAR